MDVLISSIKYDVIDRLKEIGTQRRSKANEQVKERHGKDDGTCYGAKENFVELVALHEPLCSPV